MSIPTADSVTRSRLEAWLQELDTLLSAGELEAAERFMLDHLSLLEDQDKTGSGSWLSLQNELASFYRGTSRYRESEQAFARVRELLELADQKHTLPYVTVCVNIAGCYRLQGDSEQALDCYTTAQILLTDIVELNELDPAALAQARYLTASIHNNMSLLYCDLNEFEQAVAHAEQAIALIRAGVGDEHELATSYNNLANFYLKSGRVAAAEAACQNALELYDRMPKENVHHAAALATFAELCCLEGDYLSAKTALSHALQLTEHFFGRNAEYAAIERSLSRILARETPLPL